MTFRVEEKIIVTRMQALQRLGYLLENGAEYLFPNRRVTSCYFDTRDYRVFHESEEGVLPPQSENSKLQQRGTILPRNKNIFD